MSSTAKATVIKMDGPTIPWTVADLFLWSPHRQAMVYHVMVTPLAVFNPVGAFIGGAVGLFRGYRLIPVIANGGLVGGALGMTLGLTALYNKASQGEGLKPLPWNDDGIQMRVSGLQHNYKVRTLDLSVWTGIAVATALYVARKTSPLSLLQAASLGTTVGGLSGMAFIAYTEKKIQQALNEQDEN